MNLRRKHLLLPSGELLDSSLEVENPAHEGFDTVIALAPDLWYFVGVDGVHNLFEVFGNQFKTLDTSLEGP